MAILTSTSYPAGGPNLLEFIEEPVEKSPSSKAAGSLASGAYSLVREHDKGPRTLLADFFNRH